MTVPLIYLIAGEPSGDLLGGRLMAGLKQLTGGKVAFAGIGGESMREQGLVSLFPQKDIAVMGLAEIVPRIPAIMARLSQTIKDIEEKAPDVIVTIDSWGFTGRIASRLKKRGSIVPRVHYVAPMVWAWKEKRVHQLAERVDFLMCLLPNEPALFEAAGLKSVFVGHSVLENGADKGDGAAFRARRNIPADLPLLCVLPGSRRSETSRLLPVFKETILSLAKRQGKFSVVIPTVETVADEVRKETSLWPVPVNIVEGLQERYDCFAASDAALAASGTVALELAIARLPMIIAYKVAPLTAFLARRLLKVRFVCLLNLWADRMIVPEFLQENCVAEKLGPALCDLLSNSDIRNRQLEETGKILSVLGQGEEGPSLKAARHVLNFIRGKTDDC